MMIKESTEKLAALWGYTFAQQCSEFEHSADVKYVQGCQLSHIGHVAHSLDWLHSLSCHTPDFSRWIIRLSRNTYINSESLTNRSRWLFKVNNFHTDNKIYCVSIYGGSSQYRKTLLCFSLCKKKKKKDRKWEVYKSFYMFFQTVPHQPFKTQERGRESRTFSYQ